MATIREQIADQIKADHPAHRVCEYPQAASQVPRGRLYVNVYLTDVVSRSDTYLEHTVKIDAYASRTAGAEAEDEAEDLRDDVLLSLQRMENVTWSTCQRSTFQEEFIGYQITATVTTEHVYAQIIRAEKDK